MSSEEAREPFKGLEQGWHEIVITGFLPYILADSGSSAEGRSGRPSRKHAGPIPAGCLGALSRMAREGGASCFWGRLKGTLLDFPQPDAL